MRRVLGFVFGAFALCAAPAHAADWEVLQAEKTTLANEHGAGAPDFAGSRSHVHP